MQKSQKLQNETPSRLQLLLNAPLCSTIFICFACLFVCLPVYFFFLFNLLQKIVADISDFLLKLFAVDKLV